MLSFTYGLSVSGNHECLLLVKLDLDPGAGHRRHLTDDQRVAIFAEFLPQLRKEAQENLKSTQIIGRLKGGTPIKKRRCEVDVPLKQGGVRIKLANLANVGAGKAQRTIVIAGRNPELLAQVSRGEKKLETAYNEVVGDQLAPSATESPPKALEVQVLERKVDKWLARFLSGFDPSQRPEVLRLICDFCKTRIDKLSGS